jgi:16S rRNA A1518/A1519 N6-dimethyltransferase RsmA/KsgA/DIM1 with predicted DNA glycosylase/AP lyase activity
LHISTAQSEELLQRAGINSNLRGEALTIEEWQALCEVYKKVREDLE